MKDFKWYRLWYTLFAFVFLVALLFFQVNMTTLRLFISKGFLFIAGLVLCVGGLVLMLSCIYKYFMNLSGLRSLIIENFSGQLEITGIHRYLRHPLYLGTFSFIWGLALMEPYLSLVIADSIITVYTLIAIDFEEKKLVAEFGDQYRRYKAEVPKLIPSFKRLRPVKNSSS